LRFRTPFTILALKTPSSCSHLHISVLQWIALVKVANGTSLTIPHLILWVRRRTANGQFSHGLLILTLKVTRERPARIKMSLALPVSRVLYPKFEVWRRVNKSGISENTTSLKQPTILDPSRPSQTPEATKPVSFLDTSSGRRSISQRRRSRLRPCLPSPRLGASYHQQPCACTFGNGDDVAMESSGRTPRRRRDPRVDDTRYHYYSNCAAWSICAIPRGRPSPQHNGPTEKLGPRLVGASATGASGRHGDNVGRCRWPALGFQWLIRFGSPH